TVDTLVELATKLGPTAELFFILGMDVLGQLDRWKDPERVLELCRLLVLDRPGEQGFDWAGFYRRMPGGEGRVQIVTAPPVDVSATELRRRASAGELLAAQTPDVVAGYIREQGLYLTTKEKRAAS
ncbi:MAG: nicotinate-nicotinamide nucleotide adenylyltransferase, partial [Chloroflexi bacterium]|nr:nicotinate-nicotinamide nucleotide adenylyltransferase [Chloroflexota bacterium]